MSRGQQAVIDAFETAVREGAPLPNGVEADAIARAVIVDGTPGAYAHGLGHGVGLATHEQPRLGRVVAPDPTPSPTVVTVEPGIYLEGETGVRIEDVVHIDRDRGLVERLTRFPRDVIVLPA